MTATSPDTRAGREIPWEDIREEWRSREFATLKREVNALPARAIRDVERLLREPVSAATASSALLEAFESVDATDEALLALYVYGRCFEEWELSEDYGRIDAVIAALEGVAGPMPEDGSAASLRSIVGWQARHVTDAMGVEKAMNCCCPVAMGARAALVVERLSRALDEEKKLRDVSGLEGLRQLVRDDANTGLNYFRELGRVAGAVRAYVEHEPVDFDGVRAEIDAPEVAAALKDDVYESELRPHRATLDALAARSADPRLWIRQAELAYVYPFALEGQDETEIDPSTTVSQAIERSELEDPEEKKWPRLAEIGVPPRKSGELDVNDIWVGETPVVSGVLIELPQLTVTTTAEDDLEFRPEVRLSRLGNHQVVIRSTLEDVGMHEVNQALRRGSHGMGPESVSWDGQLKRDDRLVTCQKLAEYAKAVIEAIASEFDAKTVETVNPTFHVVLAARAISREDDRTLLVTRAELESSARADQAEAGGILGASLLFHPVRHLTTSLHEWVRYPVPPIENLLEGQAYAGDLVVRTENTTFAYLPGSPEWLIAEYEDMIEFVASVPPLLKLLENRMRELDGRVSDGVLRDLGQQIRAGEDPLVELENHETEIRILESAVRRQLAILHSPELVRTRAQREFLNRLWDAAGLPDAERDLEQTLARLGERQQRIATLVSAIDQRIRREQRDAAEKARDEAERAKEEEEKRAKLIEHEQGERDKRIERRVKIVGGLLGVAAVAEVLSWANDTGRLGWPWWAWGAEAALFALVFAGLFLFLYVFTKPNP